MKGKKQILTIIFFSEEIIFFNSEHHHRHSPDEINFLKLFRCSVYFLDSGTVEECHRQEMFEYSTSFKVHFQGFSLPDRGFSRRFFFGAGFLPDVFYAF